MLVSLTKSKKSGLGFSKDQKRANVMLSRASKSLFIFGDWENSVSSQASSTPLLIPAMAHWAREKEVLYQVTATGALVSYEPTLSAATAVAPSTRVATKSAVPASLKVKATAVKSSTRIATGDRSYTLTADDQLTIALFASILTERPDKKISLSELGILYPREDRARGSLSLLAYTRLLPGFMLSLQDNMWFLSLAPPPPAPKPIAIRAPPVARTAPSPALAAAFEAAVKRVLERAGGSMSLSELGGKLTRVITDYPLISLTRSLRALDTVVVRGQLVTLKDPFVSEVRKILLEGPKGLHIGQLGNALAQSCITYPKPTLKQSLQSLSSVVVYKSGAIHILESKRTKSKKH